MVHRILYKMGTKGSGQQQFAREVYVCPQPPVEALGVSDDDLDIFTKDIPFNFAVKQVLKQLDDSRVLAEVAQLRMLDVCIPVYAELVQAVQDLSNAMYKFHK